MAFARTVRPPLTWRRILWLTTSPEQVPPDVFTVLRGHLVVGLAPLIVAAIVGATLASLAVLRVEIVETGYKSWRFKNRA